MIPIFLRGALPSVMLSALTVTIPSLQAAAAERDCASDVRKVSRDVAASPERVLLIVEDTLVVSDDCACEVVKAAIVAASASAKLTGQIVLVAVNAAPTKAALIAECAKAASPDASADIDAAVRQALGPEAAVPPSPRPSEAVAPPTKEASTDGKQPAKQSKNPVTETPVPDDETDFGVSPVAIGGVYLVYPGSGSSPQLVKGKDGQLYYIGPQGKRVPLDPVPPPRSQRPPRPPAVIIITPPTPTASENTPEDPTPIDPIPIDPIPIDPAQ